jgi:hypothetical protein
LSALRRRLFLLFPLPALLLIAVILIRSEKVWAVRTLTRHATPGSTYGALSLIAIAILLPLYYAAPRLSELLGRARGVRTPTDAELKIAGVLLRAIILVGLYAVAYGLVSRFQLG